MILANSILSTQPSAYRQTLEECLCIAYQLKYSHAVRHLMTDALASHSEEMVALVLEKKGAAFLVFVIEDIELYEFEDVGETQRVGKLHCELNLVTLKQVDRDFEVGSCTKLKKHWMYITLSPEGEIGVELDGTLSGTDRLTLGI